MKNILITGGNGVLGSALSKMFLDLGDNVSVVDIVRQDECWRLKHLNILDRIQYNWKASQDITPDDLDGIDLVLDCSIGFPDRPFGTLSTRATIESNLWPAVGLLEAIRHSGNPIPVIYPSSFNSLYGNNSVIYDERTSVAPTSIYGWTKSAVEQLYRTYSISFSIPVIITRVGSSYGEMMRTDELVAKLINSGLNGKRFSLKSPESKRLWTYLGDVIEAYRSIIEVCDYCQNEDFLEEMKSTDFVLNIAGNVGDRIVKNVELAKLIRDVMGIDIELTPLNIYEPGEIVNGKPIDFGVEAEFTRKLLSWKPKYSLVEGLKRTTEWFQEHSEQVVPWKPR